MNCMELHCFEIVAATGVHIAGLCCGKPSLYSCLCLASVPASCNREGDPAMYASFESTVRIACYVRYAIDVLNHVLDGQVGCQSERYFAGNQITLELESCGLQHDA